MQERPKRKPGKQGSNGEDTESVGKASMTLGAWLKARAEQIAKDEERDLSKYVRSLIKADFRKRGIEIPKEVEQVA